MTYFEDQCVAWRKAAGKKKSKSFSHLKNELGFNTSQVANFDVSSSGLQICAGLTGSLRGLIITNFIMPAKQYNSLVKKDFYTAFHSNLIEKIKSNKSLSEFLDPEIFRQLVLIDRAKIKTVLIAFLYSEGSHNRTLNLITLFDWTVANKSSQAHREMYKQMKMVSSLIEKEFSLGYVKISSLKQLLEVDLPSADSIKKSKGVLLDLEDGRTRSFYSCLKNEKSEHKSRKKNGSISSFTHQYFGDKFDVIGCSHSICPNFIHRVDAELLKEIIIFAKNQNIMISPSHDSFLLDCKYESVIKEAYFKAFINCVLKSDILSCFIKANSTVVHLNSQKILQNFEEDRKKILSVIESGEYIMSDFILTP